MEKSSKNRQNRRFYHDFFTFFKFFQNFTTIRSKAGTRSENIYQNTQYNEFRRKFGRIFDQTPKPNFYFNGGHFWQLHRGSTKNLL